MKQAIEHIEIDPAQFAMRLTTTLNLLRKGGACADSYKHLVKALGGLSFDHDAPINLLTILEHNGVDDCLWALSATAESCDVVARLMAADFAEGVLPIYERDYPQNMRPRVAVESAREFAIGRIGAAARDAAREAAWAAGAAGAAARAAAGEAAGAAAREAAREAAWAAGDAAGAAARAAARATQAEIIKRYLLPDQEAK